MLALLLVEWQQRNAAKLDTTTARDLQRADDCGERQQRHEARGDAQHRSGKSGFDLCHSALLSDDVWCVSTVAVGCVSVCVFSRRVLCRRLRFVPTHITYCTIAL